MKSDPARPRAKAPRRTTGDPGLPSANTRRGGASGQSPGLKPRQMRPHALDSANAIGLTAAVAALQSQWPD